VVLAGFVAPAGAGHELPFYPGYYPQEIRLETLTPAAAAAQLRGGSLHAYVGGDPFAGGRLPGTVSAVESLAGYVVLSPATAAPGVDRCPAALRAARALGAARAPGFVPHPYAVTPYHGDYLEHADLVDAARRTVEAAGREVPRLGARGALAERLLKASGAAGSTRAPEWVVEEVDLPTLLAPHAFPAGEAPWSKDGWYQAYLLQAPAMGDPAARQAADALQRRLVAGAYDGAAERADLARQLLARLGAGCERVVVGYVLRREPFNAEFSQGIENIAWDSQAGFDSDIFVRTAKLKDFPWNGWMRLGIATRPSAAWNPVAGFTDPAGRLLWAALGDPAFLSGPYGGGPVPHRAVPASVTIGGAAGVEIPADAWLPEPGTGLLREVGRGRTAKAKVVYRLWASAAHDNTRVGPADAIYPYVFAARWGTPRAKAGLEYDPAVDAATRAGRQALAGVRVVKVDSEVRRYSDITFTYVVPVIEVYLNSDATDPQELAALAPPWSPVPWHVTVLMEEAVKRGLGAFSAAESRRRGVRWLDLARDPKTRDGLAAILDGLARENHVPEALRRLVAADEAQTRWAALRQFGQRRGHYLVTSGPYQLDKWSEGAVVLQVFRDMANPLGVGTYDRFAIPRRAYVARITAKGDRLEIVPEIERLEKFLRQYRLVREPLGSTTDEDRADVPAARFVIVSADGRVAAAGVSREVATHRLVVDLKGRLKPGAYTALVALVLGDNLVNPEIATAQFRVEGSP
jgi:hypothetical protein